MLKPFTAFNAEDLLLKLNIQFFADNPNGGENPDNGENPDGGTDPQGGEPKGEHKQEQNDKKDVKTFTQEDVNAIAAREAKKAQEQFLKKLGVDKFDDVKDGMEKFKQWQESQKTDQQRLEEERNKFENDYKSALEERDNLNAKLHAITNNVDPEKVDDVIVLARAKVSEDVTIEDAISKVVEQYPHFMKAVESEQEQPKDDKKPKFSTGEHGKGEKPSELQSWLDAFSQ